MATTSHVYDSLLYFFVGGFNIQSFTPRAVLLTDAYAPDFVAHTTYADIEAFQPDDPGYDDEGVELSRDGTTLTSGVLRYDSGDPSPEWTLAATVRYAAVYDYPTGILLGLIDFGDNISGLISITFPDGLFTLQGA